MAKDLSTRLEARRHGRKFGLTLGVAFLVFAGIAIWRGHPLTTRVLGSVGALLLVGGLVAPVALLPVERAWMRLAHLLSRITTPIVMGVLFFLVITPVGLIRRAFGRYGLPRGRRGVSMWTVRPEGARRGDLTRQF